MADVEDDQKSVDSSDSSDSSEIDLTLSRDPKSLFFCNLKKKFYDEF